MNNSDVTQTENIQTNQENFIDDLINEPISEPTYDSIQEELMGDSTLLVPESFNSEMIEEASSLLYSNGQYQLLYENDVNNPFYESSINTFNYETDNEENDYLRIIYSWNFEINYDYFDFKNINIFISKNSKFKEKLNEIKNYRNQNNLCVSAFQKTGNIIKLKNKINIKKKSFVYSYFIIYYDNTKININFYGIFNQKIDEEKVLSNIIYESKYGKKGIVTNDYLFNLSSYDFIIFFKKLIVE